MIAMLKGLAVGTVVIVVFHFLVAVYLRSLRREALEKEFDEGGQNGTRDEFVAEGMRAYARSLVPRLLFAIYILPVVAAAVIVYLVNHR